MELALKKRILEFLENTPETPENKDERSELIKKVRYEACYIDINSHSICTEDLDKYGDQKRLREKLGKDVHEPYTMDDCERVSEALAETICEGYSEDLDNAISYELN